jgi:hypothetical protein
MSGARQRRGWAGEGARPPTYVGARQPARQDADLPADVGAYQPGAGVGR